MPTPKPSENRPDLKGLADQVAFALVRPVEELAALELEDGSIARPDHDRANALLEEIAPLGGLLASACAQDAYATALRQDISSWRSGGLDTPPDFARSRDAIHAPEDGMPFFFLGLYVYKRSEDKKPASGKAGGLGVLGRIAGTIMTR